jgi:hypothetical protein
MKDGTTQTTTRPGLDGWERTAIILKDNGKAGSIDVVTEDGTLVCRLNISAIPEKDWANVDIIVNPAEGQYGRLLAWDNGRPVHSIEMKGNSVLATELKGYAKAFRPKGTRDHYVLCIGCHGGEMFWNQESKQWTHHVGQANKARTLDAINWRWLTEVPAEDRFNVYAVKHWGWPDAETIIAVKHGQGFRFPTPCSFCGAGDSTVCDCDDEADDCDDEDYDDEDDYWDDLQNRDRCSRR